MHTKLPIALALSGLALISFSLPAEAGSKKKVVNKNTKVVVKQTNKTTVKKTNVTNVNIVVPKQRTRTVVKERRSVVYQPVYQPVVVERPVIVERPVVIERSRRPAIYVTDGVEVDVQRALSRRGYYTGPVDGVISERSRAAIRAYQVDNALPVSGVIDRSLLVSLDVI